MKGCLVLQRRFACVGHELAVLLKERYGLDSFCSYVIWRESYDFLSSQKDIEYTRLLLDEDVQKSYVHEKLDLDFLRDFEKEYGSVWSILNIDRILRYGQFIREYPHDTPPYGSDDLLRIVQVYIKRISAFLEEEKPDFVFMFQPGSLGIYLIYLMAKKRGIPTLVVAPNCMHNRLSISSVYDRISEAEIIFRKNRLKPSPEVTKYEEAKQFVREFRERPRVYSDDFAKFTAIGRKRQFEFLFARFWKRTIKELIGMVYQWRKQVEQRSDFSTIHPYHFVLDRVKRKLRNFIGNDSLYDMHDPDRPFVFHALSYEPELALSLLSPFDMDQIAIIKRVAQSVPAEMLVCVKEHPQMVPFRPRRYYRELKKIPNVRLLRPELSSFDVIRSATLVTTINGTAGWEACLIGKPVITFGEIFYNALPYVVRSRVPDELPKVVEQQLMRTDRDDEVLIRFVAALLEDSAVCDIHRAWNFEEDHLKRREILKDYAALLARKISEGVKKS